MTVSVCPAVVAPASVGRAVVWGATPTGRTTSVRGDPACVEPALFLATTIPCMRWPTSAETSL